MVDVNEELTRKVAEMARLEVSEEEVKVFTPQLKEALSYIDQLNEVDVKGVDGKEIEPLSHPLDLSPPFREDQVIPSPVNAEGKPKMLDPAPEVMSGGFKVPPIL